jgi:hypothetical protein
VNWNRLAWPLAAAFVLGGVEMRVAVARLEANLAAVEKRVDRIEHLMESRYAYSE